MAAKTYKIPFDVYLWDENNMGNASPVVVAKIGQKKYKFLVDTGASVCFLDKSVCLENRSLNKRITKKDEIHISLTVMGEFKSLDEKIENVCLKMNGSDFYENFYLMDLGDDTEYYDGIIGFNFLYKHKISLNIDKLYLEFKK